MLKAVWDGHTQGVSRKVYQTDYRRAYSPKYTKQNCTTL